LALAGQGVEKIDVADGLQVLSDLLRRSGPAQVGVWRVNWPAFRRRLPAGEIPAFLSTLVRPSRQTRQPAGGPDEFMRRFHAMPAGDRLALLETFIHGQLVEVLGLEASGELSSAQPWANLGLDSLMMVEMKNRLEPAFGLTLPMERLVRLCRRKTE
jgi:acyl carrier protein